MKVVTICLPESYVDGMDTLIHKDMYPSRSEVIRIAIRDLLLEELWKDKKPSGQYPLMIQPEKVIPSLERVIPIDQCH